MATTRTVKGMINMTYINPCYLNKNIKNFLTDLIIDYKYEDYSELSYSDKCNFTGLLIDASGKDAEHEFLLESNNLDQVINTFKKALCNGNDDKFLEAMKENAVNYFENTMREIFQYVVQDYHVGNDSLGISDRFIFSTPSNPSTFSWSQSC